VLGAQLMAMEPQKVEPFLSPRHQAGRSRVELELQLLEDQSDRVERVLGLECGPAEHDPGIGVPEPFAQTRIARAPVPIPHVHVKVRHQGAADTSYKVAKRVVAFSASLPRAHRRPGDGDGCVGAPLQAGLPGTLPPARAPGDRRGTPSPPTQPDVSRARQVCTEPAQPGRCGPGRCIGGAAHPTSRRTGLPPGAGWWCEHAATCRPARRLTPLPAAISAWVAAAHQAAAQTMARQVAAWRERVAAAGRPWPDARPCLDEGNRGATLGRPALARTDAYPVGRGGKRPMGPGNGSCSGRWSSGWQSTMTKSMGSSASINSLVSWRPKKKFARL
jgi:hypothetical protein